MSYFCCKVGCIPSFLCQEHAESLAVPSDGAGPIRCAGSAEARPWSGPGQGGRGAGRLAFLPSAGVAGQRLRLQRGSSALHRPALLRGCFACPESQAWHSSLAPAETARSALLRVCWAGVHLSVPSGWHPSPWAGQGSAWAPGIHPWQQLVCVPELAAPCRGGLHWCCRQDLLQAACLRLQARMSEVGDCVAS